MAEAVDPIILNMKLVDVCQCRPCDCSLTEIPQAILDCFGDSLTQGGDVHRLYVTLGQFSIIRLERDTQLLMPVYDYCMPEKECDWQRLQPGGPLRGLPAGQVPRGRILPAQQQLQPQLLPQLLSPPKPPLMPEGRFFLQSLPNCAMVAPVYLMQKRGDPDEKIRQSPGPELCL